MNIDISVIPHVIGLVGSFCVIFTYFCLENGTLKQDETKYYLINLIGAILLIISLFFNFNLGSFIIEILFIIISIKGLIRYGNIKSSIG